MSDNSAIEWTDATWNPVDGCSRISPGCVNCYAKAIHDRRHRAFLAGKNVLPLYAKPFEDVRPRFDRLELPLQWRRGRRIFVNSMSDLFHEDVPDTFLMNVFAIMEKCPQHRFQVLTKRAERMHAVMGWLGRKWAETGDPWPLPNVWLGVSVENQHFADERIQLLLQTPAAVRFISAEPLLGPVNLSRFLGPRCEICGGTATCFGVYEVPEDEPRYACDHCCGHGNEDGWCKPVSEGGIAGTPRGLDWVIFGLESGPKARDGDIAWVRSGVDDCAYAGVPAFVKQLGARPYESVHFPDDVEQKRYLNLRDKKGGDPSEWSEDLRVREFPAEGPKP